MSIEGQMGTIPQGNVREVMDGVGESLSGCYTRRLEALPVLAGRVELKLRVATDGSVRWALPLVSTLGDRTAEQCMLDAVRALRFEAPCGGEAEVTHRVEFDGGPDVRAATSVPSARVDAQVRAHRRELAACAGASGLVVNVYIAPDGSIAAAGAPAESEPQLATTECVLRAMRSWRMQSPGSWYARTTVTLP